MFKEIYEDGIVSGKTARDYTRKGYQNLMEVVEALEKKAPLPMTQKQIGEATGISKAIVFDICWNLVAHGWAEETGDGGAVRLKRATDEKDAWLGRMVMRCVRDTHGLHFGEAENVKKEA